MKVPRVAAEWDCSFCSTLILLGRCNKMNSYNWKQVCNIERPMKPLFVRKTLIYIFSRKHINGNNAVKVDRRTKNKNVPDLLFAKPPKKNKIQTSTKKFQIKHTQVRVQTSLSWNDLKPDESISEEVVQRGVRADNKKKIKLQQRNGPSCLLMKDKQEAEDIPQ